jgi:hypothetical protein
MSKKAKRKARKEALRDLKRRAERQAHEGFGLPMCLECARRLACTEAGFEKCCSELFTAALDTAAKTLGLTVANWPSGEVLVVLIRADQRGYSCDHVGLMDRAKMSIIEHAFADRKIVARTREQTATSERWCFAALSHPDRGLVQSAVKVLVPGMGWLGGEKVGQA